MFKGLSLTLSSFREGSDGSWSAGCAPAPPAFQLLSAWTFSSQSAVFCTLLILVGIAMVLTQILAVSSYSLQNGIFVAGSQGSTVEGGSPGIAASSSQVGIYRCTDMRC